MGWLYLYEFTKRSDIIQDRIKESDTRTFLPKENKFYHITKTLKHCYRGNAFSGVLWTVNEVKKYEKDTNKLINSYRYIGCDLLRWDNSDKCWGYKDMDECSGPNYYSCPLGYLDIVPEPDHEYAKEWRKQVKEYHKSKKPNFKPKKDMFVFLKDEYLLKAFKIISLKPLMAISYSGKEYKLPRKSLLREVSKEEIEKAKKYYIEHIKKIFQVEEVDETKVRDTGILGELEDRYEEFKLIPANKI